MAEPRSSWCSLAGLGWWSRAPKHHVVCWGELGARCQMPPLQLSATASSKSLLCLQHCRPAQGEPLGFPSVPHWCIWVTLAKGAGLAWCRARLSGNSTLEDLFKGQSFPDACRVLLNLQKATWSVPKAFCSASNVPSPAAASVPGLSLDYALWCFLWTSVKLSIPDSKSSCPPPL